MKHQKQIFLFLVFCFFFQFITGQAFGSNFWEDKTGEVEQVSNSGKEIDSFKEIVKEEPLEIIIQDGHANSITGTHFSRDGKRIITSSRDKTIKFWTRDGILIKSVNAKGDISRTVMSPDGNFILSSGYYPSLELWDSKGNFIHEIRGLRKGAVFTTAFSPNSNLIAAANSYKELILWDIGGRIFRRLKNTKSMVYTIAFSPDSNLMVTGEADGIMRFWNLDQGKQIKQVQAMKGIVSSLAFSPDGKTIVTGSRAIYKNIKGKYRPVGGKEIAYWTSDGRLIKRVKGPNISNMVFSEDGKHVFATGSDDKKVYLFNLKGKQIRSFKTTGSKRKSPHHISLSPDKKSLLLASRDLPDVKLVDLKGRLQQSFKTGRRWVTEVKVAPNGDSFLTGQWDNKVRRWSATGKLLKIYPAHKQAIHAIDYFPNGKKFVSAGRRIMIRDLNGKLIKVLKGHRHYTQDVKVSKDGRYILSGGGDKLVKLWNAKTGKLIRSFKGHKGAIYSVAFSPDGKRVLSGGNYSQVKLWNLKGKLIRSFKGGHRTHRTITGVAFSPDGKKIFSLESEGLVIWSETGQKLKKVRLRSEMINVGDLEISPDGKILALTEKNKIKIFDTNGNFIKSLRGHRKHPYDLAFSPDSKYLVSGSVDMTTRVWNLENNKQMALISEGKEWLMYNSDGYFDSSRSGGKLIAMTKGMKPFGIDQFAIKKNRPDLILDQLGIGTPKLKEHYYQLYLKRLKKSEIKQNCSANLSIPEVKILEEKQKGNQFELKFELKDNRAELKAYNIYVNDVPLFQQPGKKIEGNFLTVKEKIQLSSGKNKIEVSLFNQRGTEGYRAITHASYNRRIKGKLYFLGFGVSEYQKKNLNLAYADKDVKDLARHFFRYKKNYSKVLVKTYLNSQVNSAAVDQAEDFIKSAGVNDTVVLFIAGHGVYDTNSAATYYYLTHNADPENLEQTAVPFEKLEELLQKTKARKKLFLLDTCESGELNDDKQQEYYTLAASRGIRARTSRGINLLKRKKKEVARTYLYEKDRYIYNDLFRRTGAIVFSSSKGGELSYESDRIKNGFFTRALINSLKNRRSDRNRDGWISTEELRSRVSREVAKSTGDYQHPTIDRDNIYQKISFPVLK